MIRDTSINGETDATHMLSPMPREVPSLQKED
jgi:hypothetical protein